MPITMTIKEADAKTKKRFTAIFRLHKGGKVIKITHFGQRGGKTYIDEGEFNDDELDGTFGRRVFM